MKYAVISSTAPKECIHALLSLGYRILSLPPFERLGNAVNTHADMLFFTYNNMIITHRDYYKAAHGIFDTLCSECGMKLALTDDDIRAEYPYDIAFNAISLGGVLYSNTPFTSPAVTVLFSDKVRVKQGYAACSVLSLSDGCVITADRSLAAAFRERGVFVTLITNGSISLPPYDCGFIGGASGVDADMVFFCGDIDSHADAGIIKDAVRMSGKKCISLSKEPLFDVGGIKFFESSVP